MADDLSVECSECGDIAVTFPGGIVQPDADVTCPTCGTRYVVQCDEPGTEKAEVWLTKVEG